MYSKEWVGIGHRWTRKRLLLASKDQNEMDMAGMTDETVRTLLSAILYIAQR